MTTKPSPADIFGILRNDIAAELYGLYYYELPLPSPEREVIDRIMSHITEHDTALDSYYRAYYTALLPEKKILPSEDNINAPLRNKDELYCVGFNQAIDDIRQRFEGKP